MEAQSSQDFHHSSTKQSCSIPTIHISVRSWNTNSDLIKKKSPERRANFNTVRY